MIGGLEGSTAYLGLSVGRGCRGVVSAGIQVGRSSEDRRSAAAATTTCEPGPGLERRNRRGWGQGGRFTVGEEAGWVVGWYQTLMISFDFGSGVQLDRFSSPDQCCLIILSRSLFYCPLGKPPLDSHFTYTAGHRAESLPILINTYIFLAGWIKSRRIRCHSWMTPFLT